MNVGRGKSVTHVTEEAGAFVAAFIEAFVDSVVQLRLRQRWYALGGVGRTRGGTVNFALNRPGQWLLSSRPMKTGSPLKAKQAYLIANGDLRLSANQKCWPEQEKMEAALSAALEAEGWKVVRAHGYNRAKKHGFIDSQKMGVEVFRGIDPHAPLIVAESVWQYSQHLLPGLLLTAARS